MKVYLISLGCAKNLVDSQNIMGNLLNDNSFEITYDLKLADLIIINTCAFIEDAKKEAIDTILSVIEAKKKKQKVVVCGCLSTRYLEMSDLIPEVDRFVSLKEYPRLPEIINEVMGTKLLNDSFDNNKRFIDTNIASAYVKISEGCNNFCAFCAIPYIRGRFVSRPKEEIINEVTDLVKSGTKEINLISQNTSAYGLDLYKDYNLISLLKDLDNIDSDFSIRLLYLYPMQTTYDLVAYIKVSKKVLPYFDIPFQHSENPILKRMNRKETKEFNVSLIKHIKELIPDAIIRTTFIVGFPGETEEDFKGLVNFVKEMKLDRMGAFAYSKEEGTRAYTLDNQVNPRTKQRRLKELYDAQLPIALEQNKKHLNRKYKTLILEYNQDEYCYVGRNYAFAPDDIDGSVYVYSEEELKIGEVYDVEIIDYNDNSLTGKVIFNES